MTKDQKQYRIEFMPANKAGHFSEGITVRDAALELGIIIESDCAGIGSCTKCKVEIKEGANSPTRIEEQLLNSRELTKGVRLACQSSVTMDSLCLIRSNPIADGEKIMTDGLQAQVSLNPDIQKIMLQVAPAKLGEKYFDFEKIVEALKHLGYEIAGYNFQTLKDIPVALRRENYCVTAVIDQERLLAVEPGDTTQILFGVVIDIGTTTVAAKLVNVATGDVVAVNSAANPQAAHGADVVSRLHYIIQHPGGLKRLNSLIIKLINGLIINLADEVGIETSEIYKIVLAGNTVMQHIALNIDPRHLAQKPYTATFQGPARVDAKSLGISINSSGVAYAIPNLACFVGGDITSVLTILDLDKQRHYQLAIDMGTNGEIVLGSRDRLLCCSSPAGPAWEGACITWGMRATYGAIERVEIKNGEVSFRTIGGEPPVGICGSGLIDIVCGFLRAGGIDKSGRILNLAQLTNEYKNGLGDLIIDKVKEGNKLRITGIGGESESAITVSQNDIREIQLAKAAIAAGVKLLLEELEISPDEISSVYLAGAFGNHILAKDVLELGLIPQIAPEKIKFIGNAALSGAEAILKSREARIRAEQISQKIEHMEMADHPRFQDYFVDEMHFSTNDGK